jgi:hypothetical protein
MAVFEVNAGRSTTFARLTPDIPALLLVRHHFSYEQLKQTDSAISNFP